MPLCDNNPSPKVVVVKLFTSFARRLVARGERSFSCCRWSAIARKHLKLHLQHFSQIVYAEPLFMSALFIRRLSCWCQYNALRYAYMQACSRCFRRKFLDLIQHRNWWWNWCHHHQLVSSLSRATQDDNKVVCEKPLDGNKTRLRQSHSHRSAS